MREHWQYAAYGILPDCLLILHLAIEWSEFGNARTLAHAEFDAPVAHEVQAGDLFCNPCRMVGGELYDPVAQSDILRPLACSGEEHLRLRRVRILLEEMMLHFQSVVVAEPVS